MKRMIKTLAASLGVLLVAAALGFVLIFWVHHLPSSAMADHLTASELAVKDEGKSAVKWSYSELATYTDRLMMHISAYPGEQSALERSLMNYYRVWGGRLGLQEDQTEYTDESYARYWHGYELWLRPLLILTDYPGIRRINLVLQLLLTACVIGLLFKRNMKALVVPYLLMWGILLPPTLWRSMQYSSIFYVMTASVLSLLLHDRWWRQENRAWLLFLLNGIAVAYFDFLTYPPAALMAPLALLLWIRGDQPLKKRVYAIVCLSFVWAVGYVGMWAAKWVIGSALTDYDFFGNAFEQVAYRSSFTDHKGDHATILATWIRNLGPIALNPITYVAIAYAVFTAVKAHRSGGISLSDIVAFGLIFSIPFVWYAVIRNHSHIHSRYTSKSLAVSAFAALLLLKTPALKIPDSESAPKG